jgi:hypothetical protein
MDSVKQVLVISPEKEHHEKISAAMNKCGLSSIPRFLRRDCALGNSLRVSALP